MPTLAAAFVAILLTNPMQWDIYQRAGASIALVGLAVLTGATLHRWSSSQASQPMAEAEAHDSEPARRAQPVSPETTDQEPATPKLPPPKPAAPKAVSVAAKATEQESLATKGPVFSFHVVPKDAASESKAADGSPTPLDAVAFTNSAVLQVHDGDLLVLRGEAG